MKASILMTKSMEQALLYGLMVENTLANGLTENNTVMEPLWLLTDNKETENGTQEKELDG